MLAFVCYTNFSIARHLPQEGATKVPPRQDRQPSERSDSQRCTFAPFDTCTTWSTCSGRRCLWATRGREAREKAEKKMREQ